jgi:hypothetical protein
MPIRPEDLVDGRQYIVYDKPAVYRYWGNETKPDKSTHKFNVLKDGMETENYFMVSNQNLKLITTVSGEIYRDEEEAPEPDTYKPDHYYKNSFKVSDVQEEIGYNVFKALGSDDKAYKSSVWVTYALKHLCRAGNKDDVKLELKKAINYLTKALEGEFRDG